MTDESVTLTVPFPPGGSTHLTAEVLAEGLGSAGTPVTVRNLPGEHGVEAMRVTAQSSSGRAVLVGNVNANSLLPVIQRERIGFDYDASIRPVTKLAEFPSVLVTCRQDARTLGGFLAGRRDDAGVMRYGTDFRGTYVDVDLIELGRSAGVELAIRAASGALGILDDLQAGRIDVALLNAATATEFRERLIGLAVTAGQRLPAFPDVPTMAEAGFPGIGTPNWQGLFVARSVPEREVSWLHQAATTAMRRQAARERLEALGAQIATSPSPEEFAQQIGAEMDRWASMKSLIERVVEADV